MDFKWRCRIYLQLTCVNKVYSINFYGQLVYHPLEKNSKYISLKMSLPYMTDERHIEATYVKPLEMTDINDNSPKRKSSPLIDQHPEKRIKPSNGLNHRDERFIYGNPKEIIKSPPIESHESTSAVLDLSCKKSDEEHVKRNDATYQNFPRNNHPFVQEPYAPRSNLEIKLVNSTMKRPSTTEQLQIAKIQQQQRRSIQQQQKMLQQMRRTLDAGGRALPPKPPEEDKHMPLGGLFPHPPPPPTGGFMDPSGQGKELPDGHPVLPLLDPVYFSALYNAHGFLPPSSPSIAAAFIGTLQDALPKLSMMFPPPTSSSAGSSVLHQKGGENLN